MANGVTCRRAIRPQYGEYKVHKTPGDDGTGEILKWKLLGIFGLCVLLLGGFGYTYAYLTDASGHNGNVFYSAASEDILEISPGSATVYEPDPTRDKEKVAQYNDDGALRLDFGIIHDKGIKKFKDVLKVRNRLQTPVVIEVGLSGPVSKVITGWEKNITLNPALEAGSIYVNSSSENTEVNEFAYGGPRPVAGSVYGLPTVEETAYGPAGESFGNSPGKPAAVGSTEWQELDFSLTGSVEQGTYAGTLILTGMNGYLRMEIPVTVTVAEKMDKNDPGQQYQENDKKSGEPAVQEQEEHNNPGQTGNGSVDTGWPEKDTSENNGDTGNNEQADAFPDPGSDSANGPGGAADNPGDNAGTGGTEGGADNKQ